MIKVGLTGGIGSGKSVVAKVFETLGVPLYNADEAAKRLMQEDEALKRSIRQAFGEEAYVDGKLNRAYLASQVFNDPAKLKQLNGLVHPRVIADGYDWMQRQQAPYSIKEAAIFFESGSAAGIDVMIGVYAPQALRIQRVMHRDGIPREEVIKRMQQQIDEEIKMRLCDHVIRNDDQQMVIPQVLALHELLLKRSLEPAT